MVEARIYYAIIDEAGVCIGLIDTFEPREGLEYIPIEAYDELMLDRKMWTGSEWVDNPNYVESAQIL